MRLADDRQISRIAAEQDRIQPDDACSIQFTSGTTGQPKAVVLSHFSVVNNGAQVADRFQLDRKQHRICMQMPYFHVFGQVGGIMVPLHHGATVVLPSAAYDVKASLRAITNEKYMQLRMELLENVVNISHSFVCF